MPVTDEQADALLPPGRGGRRAVQWNRFLRDPAAVHAAARTRRVVVGTHPADALRKYGVGVPLLWPPAVSPTLRHAPLGIQVFQALTRPPASWLWAAASTDERIVASLHIEFVDDVARVCEAVDIQADAIGRDYVLSVEPVASAIGRCLDTVGFSAAPTGDGLRTRLRACVPLRWDGGEAQPVLSEQMRSLILHLTPGQDGAPTVDDQRRHDCDDVRPVPIRPTRGDVAGALDDFFRGP